MVILLFGLSGSGKTTLAEEFARVDPNVFILDGDEIRKGLCSDLGFDAKDRRENLRRVAHVARLLSLSGRTAIISMIAPYKLDREMVTEICSDVRFIDIFVYCPLEICEKRDTKGLYKKARAGEIKKFTGVTDPFEEPVNPTYRVNTNGDEDCRRIVGRLLLSIFNS